MALNFLNISRSYDPSRRSVSFWGHDDWTEITFDVSEDALQHVDSQPHPDERATLLAFDANRPRIERAAWNAYAKRRLTFLRLQPADF